jgi:predicted DNA-binding transcriptional regulator AlpA
MAQTADRTTETNPNLPIPGARATAAQLCARYQISRTTFWRWSRAPGFPAPIGYARSVRWDVDAVEAFLSQKDS